MDTVDFTAVAPVEITNHTSKGNQMKWMWHGEWYKVDHMGYEAAAEVLVSQLLARSSISIPFVAYSLVQIAYHGQLYTGCCSRNFLAEGEHLIPLEKLYRQYTGTSLADTLVTLDDETERIRYTVEQVERFTGLVGFGPYLTAMLETDAFFLNEDRHMNNIAVLYQPQTRSYRFCPLFDQGLALLADTTLDFSLERSLDDCLAHIEAKPFSRSFDRQLDAAEALYGIQLHFDFHARELPALLAPLRALYPEAVCARIEELLHRQMRRYAYLMP